MTWGVTRRWRRICHSWRRRRRRRGEHGILRNRGHHPGALSLRVTEPIVGHLGSPKISVLPLRRLLRPRLTIGGPLLSWRRVLDRPLLGRHGILPLHWLRRRLHPWDLPRRCRPFTHRALDPRLVIGTRVGHAHGARQTQIQPALWADCIVCTHLGAASRTKHSHLHPRVAAQEYGILSPAPVTLALST